MYCPSGCGTANDESEAFARAVFGRFLRQATICRDIDDAIEHMHIVNDNSRTFCIRLGGEVRIPVGRELILALAAKKKELLGLCESSLRTSRPSSAIGPPPPASAEAAGGGRASGAGKGGIASASTGAGGVSSPPRTEPLIFPPAAALAATGSTTTIAGDVPSPVPKLVVAPVAPLVGLEVDGASPVSARRLASGEVEADSPEMERVETNRESAKLAPPMEALATPMDSSSSPATKSETGPATYPAPPIPSSGAQTPQPSRDEEPKTIFVRKVDAKIDRAEFIRHFQAFGEVNDISMNPNRGYAFVDFVSHDCVVRAVSMKNHIVNNKVLQVEEKKELPHGTRPRQGVRGAAAGAAGGGVRSTGAGSGGLS